MRSARNIYQIIFKWYSGITPIEKLTQSELHYLRRTFLRLPNNGILQYTSRQSQAYIQPAWRTGARTLIEFPATKHPLPTTPHNLLHSTSLIVFTQRHSPNLRTALNAQWDKYLLWLTLSHRTWGGEALLQLGVSSGVNGYVAVIRALGTLPNCHLKQIAKAQNFADFGTQRRMETEEAGGWTATGALTTMAPSFITWHAPFTTRFPQFVSLSQVVNVLIWKFLPPACQSGP